MSAYLASCFFSQPWISAVLFFLAHTFLVCPCALAIPMLKLATLHQLEDASVFSSFDLAGRAFPLYNLLSAMTAGAFDRLLRDEGRPFFSSDMDFHFLGQWSGMCLASAATLVATVYFLERHRAKDSASAITKA